jgi:ABC-2 type transport system permease protein
MPAIAMRLWSEERKAGTIELIMTLPVGLGDIILGKFLAAWCFTAIALALTFPMWLTAIYLGHPDNGVILASYLGSLLMAGGYLAISSCMSAITKNQVIAFVLGVVVCFLFTVSGAPMVLDFFSSWAPRVLVQAIASFSFLDHFNSITEGVIYLRDIVFFASLIAFWLFANAVVVNLKKAG